MGAPAGTARAMRITSAPRNVNARPARATPPAMPGGALSPAARRRFAAHVARLAVRSLYQELSLYPKPGLVSLVDNGSHDDMDATTFMRSLFALRHYFRRICLAGAADAPFSELKRLGIAAERAMLVATGGINTHRGAIFSLGLLCATAGRARAQGTPLSPAGLRAALLIRWGDELAAHSVAGGGVGISANANADANDSNGLRVAALHAASGAREEGALGLPSVFEVGVPAQRAALARGASASAARIDTLFALMAHVSDTNVYHRAGPAGAQLVREQARGFIDRGGSAAPGWRDAALTCHRLFVSRRLSPGGAADLLAASCLVLALAVLQHDVRQDDLLLGDVHQRGSPAGGVPGDGSKERNVPQDGVRKGAAP